MEQVLRWAAYGAALVGGAWLLRRFARHHIFSPPKFKGVFWPFPALGRCALTSRQPAVHAGKGFTATVALPTIPDLGELLVRDFRPSPAASSATAAAEDGKHEPRPTAFVDGKKGVWHAPPPAAANTVRVVAWNIERGYQLKRVIEVLRVIKPDVLLLSEVGVLLHPCVCCDDDGREFGWCWLAMRCDGQVDIGTARSNRVDCGAEIASALGLLYAFAPEIELSGGGGAHPPGAEGMAILSRFPLTDLHSLILPCTRNGWTKPHWREKTHVALCGTVQLPPALGGPMRVCSVHLEAYSGARGHIQQFEVSPVWLCAACLCVCVCVRVQRS
jgi:hypothetical protein